MTECPNFLVCHKIYDPRLKVCTSCFWRFKNEVLEFKDDECSICHKTIKCVKYRKCSHFVCLKCFKTNNKCSIPKCTQKV